MASAVPGKVSTLYGHLPDLAALHGCNWCRMPGRNPMWYVYSSGILKIIITHSFPLGLVRLCAGLS